MEQKRRKALNSILNGYIIFGVAALALSAVIILLPIGTTIIYHLYPNAQDNERESLTQNLEEDLDTFEEILSKRKPAEPVEDPLPPFDPSLPEINTILIPNFEVNSAIQEGSDYDTALNNGPWRVPEFGDPENSFAPVIIASHRWGVIGWDNQQRRERSFIRLPEVVEGEKIEIIWNQRKYIYEVYKAENSTEITDYDADLILYTCQFYWPSPERIFRYAKRVN